MKQYKVSYRRWHNDVWVSESMIISPDPITQVLTILLPHGLYREGVTIEEIK